MIGGIGVATCDLHKSKGHPSRATYFPPESAQVPLTGLREEAMLIAIYHPVSDDEGAQRASSVGACYLVDVNILYFLGCILLCANSLLNRVKMNRVRCC